MIILTFEDSCHKFITQKYTPWNSVSRGSFKIVYVFALANRRNAEKLMLLFGSYSYDVKFFLTIFNLHSLLMYFSWYFLTCSHKYWNGLEYIKRENIFVCILLRRTSTDWVLWQNCDLLTIKKLVFIQSFDCPVDKLQSEFV